MILVILGTQNKPFNRLLKAIDKQIKDGNIKDKVVVQAGQTLYKSDNMEIFDFLSMDKFDKLLKNADLIITHGGVGTILQAIRKRKKVIAVPRLSRYKEHVNDHQKQIVNEFAKNGHILKCENLSKLDEVIKESTKFTPIPYKGSNSLMMSILENYIDNT